MNKQLLKKAYSLVMSAAAGTVVSQFIKQNVVSHGRWSSIVISIGSFAIAGIVSSKVTDCSEKEFDETMEIIESLKGKPVTGPDPINVSE